MFNQMIWYNAYQISKDNKNRQNDQMQVFRPFRATVHRQQKYYAQKRPPVDPKGSVFNLPRQILSQRSISVINPEIPIMAEPSQRNKFVSDYQINLKKTVKKHSVQILNKKALEKIASSYLESEKKVYADNIIRNKSSQLYPNKNMAFRTLNILYRTIIQTKVKRKPRQRFQLSAKKLPIVQKNTQTLDIKKIKQSNQPIQRNSSFDKYKLSLTSIKDESGLGSWGKYMGNNSQRHLQNIQEQQFRDGDRMSFFGRRKRFERGEDSRKQANQIIPWDDRSEVQREDEDSGLG